MSWCLEESVREGGLGLASGRGDWKENVAFSIQGARVPWEVAAEGRAFRREEGGREVGEMAQAGSPFGGW